MTTVGSRGWPRNMVPWRALPNRWKRERVRSDRGRMKYSVADGGSPLRPKRPVIVRDTLATTHALARPLGGEAPLAGEPCERALDHRRAATGLGPRSSDRLARRILPVHRSVAQTARALSAIRRAPAAVWPA